MYYVYILKSKKDSKTYTGWTPNLKRRVVEHDSGLVMSTKSRRPFELIYYEAFTNKKDSLMREKFFKTGWGRIHLKKALKFTLMA